MDHIQNWKRVRVDLRQTDRSPISTYQETCAWLSLHAKGEWLHSSTATDQTITYFIKDPELAMLFKLTWG
jgi:hypothetical protein